MNVPIGGKKKKESRGRAKNIFTEIDTYIHAGGQDTRGDSGVQGDV